MAEDVQRALDGEWHRKSYVAIMKWSGEVGVPLALAAAVLFTNLTMANGLLTAFVGAFVTFLFARWVVRTFFSH